MGGPGWRCSMPPIQFPFCTLHKKHYAIILEGFLWSYNALGRSVQRKFFLRRMQNSSHFSQNVARNCLTPMKENRENKGEEGGREGELKELKKYIIYVSRILLFEFFFFFFFLDRRNFGILVDRFSSWLSFLFLWCRVPLDIKR